uniref:Uncharacterized protein n=1 Tax=Ciona savignyi TaxID=51511 RepID=H2ZG26_CIOSA
MIKILVILLLFVISQSQAEDLAVNDCKLLKPNDKSQLLLNRLAPLKGHVFKYKFKDEVLGGDEYEYTLSICSGVDAEDYHVPGVGVLQYSSALKKYNTVGLLNSTIVKGGTDWIMLTYQHGDTYNTHCKSPTSSKLSRRQAHI